jgi:hypothetical protein
MTDKMAARVTWTYLLVTAAVVAVGLWFFWLTRDVPRPKALDTTRYPRRSSTDCSSWW